jgi:hypothetical protein
MSSAIANQRAMNARGQATTFGQSDPATATAMRNRVPPSITRVSA